MRLTGFFPQFRYNCGIEHFLAQSLMGRPIQAQHIHLERIPGGEIPPQFDFSVPNFGFSRASLRG